MSEQVTMSVDPGVCRFKAKIIAKECDDHICIEMETACPHAQAFQKTLSKVERFDALKMPFSENVVYQKAGETLKHSACPLPAAVIKCIEAASGLALKKNVKFEYDL
jgi:hypothetical protein